MIKNEEHNVAEEFDNFPNGIHSVKPSDFINHLTSLIVKDKNGELKNGMFVGKTANQWLFESKSLPIPKMLFGEFWFEGELCFLYADTNLGKSILAVQIADSISSGLPVECYKLEAQRQLVYYFDFELNLKQFEARYSNQFEEHYQFDDNFFRIEIDSNTQIPETSNFEDYLIYSFEQCLISRPAKVVIIDNVTYLRHDNQQAKDASSLMRKLKELKNKYNLSILVLAHTPKRDLTKPLTRNDLQGSKMLINFCDSAFSIGESTIDKSIRYLKQIKARNTDIIYDADNVSVLRIEKSHNFLQFIFLNFGKEYEHLKSISEKEKNDLETSIKELMNAEPKLSSYAIAKKLCTERDKFESFKVKVNRIIHRFQERSNNSNNGNE